MSVFITNIIISMFALTFIKLDAETKESTRLPKSPELQHLKHSEGATKCLRVSKSCDPIGRDIQLF